MNVLLLDLCAYAYLEIEETQKYVEINDRVLFYVCHKLNGKNTILHDDG
jgi:hypothetical protein